MPTATDIMMRNKEREGRIFEAMIESFLKRWMPNDHHDAVQFERELHMLVRQIYQDAQAPLLDHITKIYSVMPMLPATIIKP